MFINSSNDSEYTNTLYIDFGSGHSGLTKYIAKCHYHQIVKKNPKTDDMSRDEYIELQNELAEKSGVKFINVDRDLPKGKSHRKYYNYYTVRENINIADFDISEFIRE